LKLTGNDSWRLLLTLKLSATLNMLNLIF
jgi:hypothetical protein